MRVFRTSELSLAEIGRQLLPPAADVAQRQASVDAIVARVRDEGDPAVLEYVRRFDWPEATLAGLQVTEAEFDRAMAEVDPALIGAMTVAAENIRRYAQRQMPQDWYEEMGWGLMLGQRHVPVESVACYVPTGKASLPSSLLMSVVPAQVAGVSRIVVIGPSRRDGTMPAGVLAAASLLGITEVYKMGSAWGIAALAFGTETFTPVKKIVGPTPSFGSMAKRAVYGTVGIDGLNGPSDVTIVADGTTPAAWVASDLLSQAEHGPDSPGMLVTPDAAYAEAVGEEIRKQLAASPRANYLEVSLTERGAIIITRDLAEATEMANILAPEHLELSVADPQAALARIRHAGAIFLGGMTPVAAGDYLAGPSHILPTDRTAQFASGLGVQDFLTRSSLISTSRDWLEAQREHLVTFAEHEGLDAHADSVRRRTE